MSFVCVVSGHLCECHPNVSARSSVLTPSTNFSPGARPDTALGHRKAAQRTVGPRPQRRLEFTLLVEGAAMS